MIARDPPDIPFFGYDNFFPSVLLVGIGGVILKNLVGAIGSVTNLIRQPVRRELTGNHGSERESFLHPLLNICAGHVGLHAL